MFSQFKRLGADSLLYALMNVGTKLIAFIMLPIYTRFLGGKLYGVLGNIDSITSMLTFLIIFGTDSALAFYYFDTKDKEKKLEYVRNVMYFRLFVIVILALMVVLAGPWISFLITGKTEYVPLLYISIATLVVDSVTIVALMVMRFDFISKKVVFYTVAKMLLMAIFSYIFLKYYVRTPEGILWGRFIGYGIVFVLLLPTSWKYLTPKIKMDSLKEILKYAAPLVPASLAFWVIANISKIILTHFKSLSDAGMYNAANGLAMIITLLTSGVLLAWRPYSMTMKDKKDSPVLFAKIYLVLLLIGIVGILAIATVAPYIILILDKNFYSAYQYIALISAATFLNFYYMIISVGLFFNKKTAAITITFIIVAVINIVLNFALIPQYSIWGAVAAYLAAYMVAIVFIFRKSQQEYYVPVSLGKMAVLFISMIAAVVWIVYVQQHDMSILYEAAAWIFVAVVTAICRVDKDFARKTYHVPEKMNSGQL